MFDGFRVPALQGQRIAQVKVRLGIIRLDRQRLPVLLNGLRISPQVGEGIAEIVSYHCIVGLYLKGPLKIFQGLGRPALFGQDSA